MKKILTLLAICLIASNVILAQQGNLLPGQVRTSQPNRETADLVRSHRAMELATIPNNRVDYSARIAGFHTDDDYIDVTYFYDNNGRCLKLYSEDGYSDNRVIYYDSLIYNNLGQIVRLEGWQYTHDLWLNCNYVDYTYNAQGLVASRTNYNYFDGEFELGGIYDYSYNDAGQIVLEELTFMGGPFDRKEYFYENGKIDYALYSYNDIFDGNGWVEASKYEYEYNAMGKVSRITNYQNYNGWMLFGYEEFIYDEVGNCIEHNRYDQYDEMVERSLYEYEHRMLENTLIPNVPEQTRPVLYTNVNTYNVEHYYSLDDNFVLQYICDYLYDYETYVGVTEHTSNDLTLYPNPAAGQITVETTDGDYLLRIFDMQGRCVKLERLDGNARTFDVSALQSGTYIVRLEGTTSRTTKLVIK